MSHQRRYAALHLPKLLCEMTRAQDDAPPISAPWGIVLGDEDGATAPSKTRLDAVNEAAVTARIRPGMTITEAHAMTAGLHVAWVSPQQSTLRLEQVAELGLSVSPIVGLAPPDTVYLDLTGATHLLGGELATAQHLVTVTRALGHDAQVAIANGPHLAEAVARFAQSPVTIIPEDQTRQAARRLPIESLPVTSEVIRWLHRLGVRHLDHLARLPRRQLIARLGDGARVALAWLDGRDDTIFPTFSPTEDWSEASSFDTSIENIEGLSFVLNRLTERLSTRLQARGLALRGMSLSIEHDASIARLRHAPDHDTLRLSLPAPISHPEQLLRVWRTKLERHKLRAPITSISLHALLLTPAQTHQLSLSRSPEPPPHALPTLLAELSSELGTTHVGTLSLHDDFRPERRSPLVPVVSLTAPDTPSPPALTWDTAITRLLPAPLPLGPLPLHAGARFVLEHPAHATPSLRLLKALGEVRLDGIAWWTKHPVRRDYVRAWIRQEQALAIGWLFRQPDTKDMWLHGWSD